MRSMRSEANSWLAELKWRVNDLVLLMHTPVPRPLLLTKWVTPPAACTTSLTKQAGPWSSAPVTFSTTVRVGEPLQTSDGC
jgi:hypothetical protein